MNHRLAVFVLAVAFCVSLTGFVPVLSVASGSGSHASASAKKAKGQKKKAPKAKFFVVCKHGCQFRTIQRAVNAAGAFKHEKKNAKTRAIVEVMPGKYVEGVVLDGTRRKYDFEGLTIIGAKKNPRKTILEGKNAKGELGAAQNGIEVVGVDGVVIKNMWARNYESNGFFVHASTQSGQHCDGYTMNNLLASGNRSYGLFAKGCRGGKMLNSTGFRQGDSAFYIGETPCDTTTWTNHGTAPAPCQAKPKWSVLRNDVSYENVLGYSGTNSKYVLITESDFFNNGAGIVPNTLDSEGYEPNGWNVFEKNNVFWNNYNYFLSGSAFQTVSGGLGEVAGVTVNYPTGTGIVLYGSANTVVRDNDVFGNYKWGIASFSGPGEGFVANEGDDAKNINNKIVENTMGRGGLDPNGEFDFLNDASGGGNCWAANSPGTYAPGNGSTPLAQIYPVCPQPPVIADQVKSLNLPAGIQVRLSDVSNPATVLGYTSSNPPQIQQCSWVRRVAAHPPFEKRKPAEAAPLPGELACG